MRKFRYYKFVVYRFLSRFSPYFKKLIKMSMEELKEDIKTELKNILNDKFSNLLIIEDILDDSATHQNLSYASEKIDSATIKYIVSLKHNYNKEVQLFINYTKATKFSRDLLTYNFVFGQVKINTSIMCDLIKLENILKENEENLIRRFESVNLLSQKKLR